VPVGGGGGVAVLLGALLGDHGRVGVGEEAAQLGGDRGGPVGGAAVAPVEVDLAGPGRVLGVQRRAFGRDGAPLAGRGGREAGAVAAASRSLRSARSRCTSSEPSRKLRGLVAVSST